MKKLISLLLVAVICLFTLLSCSDTNDSSGEDRVKIKIGYMAGPTGMGMAKLIHDNGGVQGNENYEFKKFADTQAAKAELAAGKIDLICLPTNEAAIYFNNGISDIKVLAINCLNSLYLLSDSNTDIKSLSDLNGKTIYTCKNGTPRLILEEVLKTNGITATVSYTYNGKEILTPAEVGSLVVSGDLPIAVMPEPIVTSSLLTINKNGNTSISYSVDLNLADGWKSGGINTPITMGCIVGSADFIKNNETTIDAFLAEYKASIEYISKSENRDTAADYVVETGVMAAKPAALKALTNLDDAISYIDGSQMKSALVKFYQVIGISSTKADFYYE